MKKLALIALALLLLLSSVSALAAEDKLVYGNIAYYMADDWNMYSTKAFTFAAEKNGVEVIVMDSENSIETSIACMESLIQQGVDGICLFPISGPQAATLIDMANEAGIPITIENLDISAFAPDDSYIHAVGCVYADIGYAAIEWLAKNIENPKVFYCAGAVGGGVYEFYQEGVDKALADYAGQIEIVGILNTTNWSTEDGLRLTENFINSGTEFNAIFANSDQIAIGCYQALETFGMTDIPIVSTGGSPDAYGMIEEGIEAANMTAPVSLQGVMAFKDLHEYVTEGKIAETKFSNLPVIPVGKDNMGDWIDWTDYAFAYDYVYGLQ